MTVGAFLADSGQLLAEYPNGGAQMIAQIRDLAVANPAVLLPILSLLSNANKYELALQCQQVSEVRDRQRPPTGRQTGAPHKSALCLRHPGRRARTKDQEVVLAYEGNTSDKDLGTIGTGQGGGGALGGQTNSLGQSRGGSSGSSATGTNATSNSGNFTTTGGGVSSGGSTTASGLSQASSP